MFCPNCGVENPDSAAECRRCHVPFHDEPPAEAAPEANAAGTICTHCETFNEPGVERCTTCGNVLGAAHEAPMDATPAEAQAAHDPLAELAAHAHQQAHEAPHEAHPHDDPGSTHALEPVSASDTPAEGNPSIADELSALELSPEDARAARGEDATPPDGSAPLPSQTAEHKLDLSASEEESTSVAENPFDEEHAESTNVSQNPFDEAQAAAAPAHAEPALDHTPPAPMRIAAAPRKAAAAAPPPPPVPTPAPAVAAPEPAAAAEKICASCASVNLPNAKFCAECGTPFPKKAAAPAVTAPPPAPVPTPAPAVAARPAPAAAREPAEEAASPADHTPPQPRRAESLQAAMEQALDAQPHDHTPAEAHRIPVSEDAHEEHSEAAAHGETPAQSGFDPTRTDQAKAEAAVDPEQHDQTSEQPRLELSGDGAAHEAASAPEHEQEAVHHDSLEEEPSVSIESMEPVSPRAGEEEPPPADATPAEPYATDAAAEENPLPEEQPEHEPAGLEAQADALPEEHEAAPQQAEQPEHEHPTQEEPAFEAAEGHDPLAEEPLATEELAAEEVPQEEQPIDAAQAEEQPIDEAQAEQQPIDEAQAEEQPIDEAQAEEQPIDEAPAEEQPIDEAPAEEAPAEEPLAEEPLAAEGEQPYEEAAPEPIAAPYAVQLIVEQGAQAGTSFQLPYTENSVGSAGGSVELGEDVHLAPHHATVLFEDQRLLLRDEGTANGVFLKLRLAGALEPGDQFIAGQRLFRFDGPVELPQAEGTPPFQGAPRPAGTPVRIVEVLAGGKQGRTCHRSGPVIAVGKTGCDLNFGSDALLAARHAEIHLGEDGTASLLDLGNAESGVLLRVRNGASVELQAGDVLQLGGQTVRIETEPAAEA